MFSINPTASIKKKIVKVRSESPLQQPPAYDTTPDTQVNIYSILKHNRIYKNVLRELIKRTIFLEWLKTFDIVMEEYKEKSAIYFAYKEKKNTKIIIKKKRGAAAGARG